MKNKELIEMFQDIKPKITVADSIMGSGKTTWSIEHMNNANIESKFIYITPFLDEVQRVKDSVKSRTFYEPSTKNECGSKIHDFETLVKQGKDIVSTHALFKSIKPDLLEWIIINGYTLILDEVINVIDTIQISKHDYDTLVDRGMITIEENGKITWSKNYIDYEGKFSDIMQQAINNNLYKHSRSGNGKYELLVWTFPASVFKVFKEVYILTYLFDGQLQKYYYDMFNLQYEYKSVECINGIYKLVDYVGKDKEDRSRIRGLINIYDGNLNNIGKEKYNLSSSWLKSSKNLEKLEVLKRNTINYFKNIVKTNSELNMWTTIKGDEDKKEKVKGKLKGKGYINGFVSCNARATNNFSHKQSLAYLLNRFLNPLDKGFFQDKGIVVDEDKWSLSELIQWIWRSRIRNGESINLYIPSSRMRGLLIDYLNNVI